jgi:hypothetical protein
MGGSKKSAVPLSHVLVLAAIALAFVRPLRARAEEGGAGHYTPGAMASFADALPGRSTVALVNFFTFYDASSPRLELGGLVAAGVDATVYADTILGLYQTPFQLLGGDYAVAMAIPIVFLEVTGEVTTTRPGVLGGGTTTRRVRDTTDGIGDITLYPFMLGWTALGGDLKYDVRFGIYAPTGGYERGQLANAGKNYWTFEPGIMASYVSSKIGTEVSAYFGADVNTENTDTHYQSGEVVHLDGTIAQHFPLAGGFGGIGATGFFYEQISGDSGSGANLGSFEGHSEGIGPVGSYATKIAGHDLLGEAKWMRELGVEKRLEGDYVWFKLVFAF